MSTLVPSDASAGEHIQITREILIESGNAAMPNVMMLAADGDLILAGSLGPSAWATRVGPNGEVRWRHVVQIDHSPGRLLDSVYSHAAMLPDGSTIMCGSAEVKFKHGENIVAYLTRIDKTGRVVYEKTFYPKDNRQYQTTYLDTCVASGESVVITGRSSFVWGDHIPRNSELYSYEITLDQQGSFTSEKLTKYKDLPVRYSSSLPLQENGLVGLNISHRFNQPGNLVDTSLIHISPSGEVLARKSYSDTSLMFVEPTSPDGRVRLMPNVQTDSAYLLTLSTNLEQQERIDGLAGTALPKRAFYLPDHSVVIFGADYYQSNVTSASVAWLSPDLKRTERLMFEPPTEAGEIADAVPTGRPGEFVTARTVTPVRRIVGPDVSDRIGVAIAFIRIR